MKQKEVSVSFLDLFFFPHKIHVLDIVIADETETKTKSHAHNEEHDENTLLAELEQHLENEDAGGECIDICAQANESKRIPIEPLYIECGQ